MNILCVAPQAALFTAMTAHVFQAVNKHIGHLDQCERGLTAVATEPHKVGLSGFLKAPEAAGHVMRLHRAATDVKSPWLAPKTGAQTWATLLRYQMLNARC